MYEIYKYEYISWMQRFSQDVYIYSWQCLPRVQVHIIIHEFYMHQIS